MNSHREKVSCIIPAFNEARRITPVLRIAISHPLISEVIVIDDGSSDGTLTVLKKFKNIKIIRNSKNKGKSFSVMKGLELAKHEIILLLDADLEGLKTENLTSLINPVLNHTAQITISARKNIPVFRKLIGVDYISGERVFNKKIIPDYKQLSKIKGYSLEVFLNKIIIDNKLLLKIIKWNNVRGPEKYEKSTLLYGIKQELQMVRHMLNTIGIIGCLYQMYMLRRLKIRD